MNSLYLLFQIYYLKLVSNEVQFLNRANKLITLIVLYLHHIGFIEYSIINRWFKYTVYNILTYTIKLPDLIFT